VNFRPITAADLPTVEAFAIEGLRPDLYPLHLSRDKVRAVIGHFAKPNNDFSLAAFDGEQMVGGIAAVVQEQLWFERHEAIVVMCYATVPGVGRTLVRRLMEWVSDEPRVRVVRWPCEFDAPRSMVRLAQMCGFNSFNATASYYKV
jgi:hypothetical protein